MIPSLDSIRTTLVAEIEAAASVFTDYPVQIEYENRDLINYETVVNPFLSVELRPIKAGQMDLSHNPWQGIHQHLILTAKTREGQGVSKINDLLDHFYRLVHCRSLAHGIVTGVADLIPGPQRRAGFYGLSAIVLVTAYRLSK